MNDFETKSYFSSLINNEENNDSEYNNHHLSRNFCPEKVLKP